MNDDKIALALQKKQFDIDNLTAGVVDINQFNGWELKSSPSGPPHLQEEIASCWRWKDAPETNDEDDENAPAFNGKSPNQDNFSEFIRDLLAFLGSRGSPRNI